MHQAGPSFQHELRRISRLVRSDFRSQFTARSFAISTRGTREPINQDSYLAADHFPGPNRSHLGIRPPNGHSVDPGDSLFVVADGQGPPHEGCRAGALAIEVIEESLRFTWMHYQTRNLVARPGQILNALRVAFDRADQFLWKEGQTQNAHQEAEASITAVCSCRENLFLAHAGETQAYLWRANRLHRLTRPTPHYFGDRDTEPSQIEVRRQANLNHKTSQVGGYRPGVHVKLRMLDLEPNDYLVLCTKGLASLIKDHFLSATISANPDPRTICELLIAEAERMFVHDDLTVIVTRFALAHEKGMESRQLA